jgi:hypothetical protein
MADTVITVTYTPFDTFQSTDIITVPTSTGTGTTATNRLDGLDDVEEATGVSNNMTLVYNSDTDKYVVKELDLDGGTF